MFFNRMFGSYTFFDFTQDMASLWSYDTFDDKREDINSAELTYSGIVSRLKSVIPHMSAIFESEYGVSCYAQDNVIFKIGILLRVAARHPKRESAQLFNLLMQHVPKKIMLSVIERHYDPELCYDVDHIVRWYLMEHNIVAYCYLNLRLRALAHKIFSYDMYGYDSRTYKETLKILLTYIEKGALTILNKALQDSQDELFICEGMATKAAVDITAHPVLELVKYKEMSSHIFSKVLNLDSKCRLYKRSAVLVMNTFLTQYLTKLIQEQSGFIVFLCVIINRTGIVPPITYTQASTVHYSALVTFLPRNLTDIIAAYDSMFERKCQARETAFSLGYKMNTLLFSPVDFLNAYHITLCLLNAFISETPGRIVLDYTRDESEPTEIAPEFTQAASELSMHIRR